MKVILIDDVYGLGRRGEVANVADGYGRNYLIPKQLAVVATTGNLKMIEEQRVALAKKESKYVEEAELLAQELGQLHVIISRKAGDTGVLFGSVTSKDLEEVLSANGINLDRRKILLAQPIKSIGNYRVEARPHNDVETNLLVSVTPEGDEPVARTMPRGEESDAVVKDVEVKVAEIEALSSASTDEVEAE
jgi:large subunit ribosomal protein L9